MASAANNRKITKTPQYINMKLSQFKFNLPKDQVALYPHSSKRVLTRTDGSTQTFTVTRRDEGRLMVLHRKSGHDSLK